jgi:hypothetical protein
MKGDTLHINVTMDQMNPAMRRSTSIVSDLLRAVDSSSNNHHSTGEYDIVVAFSSDRLFAGMVSSRPGLPARTGEKLSLMGAAGILMSFV